LLILWKRRWWVIVVGDGGVVFQLLFRFGWVGKGIIVVDIVGRGCRSGGSSAGEPGNVTLKLLVAADRVAALLRWRLLRRGFAMVGCFDCLCFYERCALRCGWWKNKRTKTRAICL
jgi:hypothetical protein